jgi:hypothetical protein
MCLFAHRPSSRAEKCPGPIGVPSGMTNLLKYFFNVFDKPHGLPPRQFKDYRIPLKEGMRTVNVRTYQCVHSQKDEIKKLMKEILNQRHHLAECELFLLSSVLGKEEGQNVEVLCRLLALE